METVRVTINANCRLRNVYFSDKLYTDEEKPAVFKFMALPKEKKRKEVKITSKPEENVIESVRPTSPVTVQS